MKNKSFLSKVDELKPKAPIHLEVERKLLPRLKFMGYVMYSLCLASFLFALLIKEDTTVIGPPSQEGFTPPDQTEAMIDLLLEEGELELSPTEVLNFYFVAVIFAAIGASCFLIAWKKKKTLTPSQE
jgi:hypothetical protein